MKPALAIVQEHAIALVGTQIFSAGGEVPRIGDPELAVFGIEIPETRHLSTAVEWL